MVGRAHGTVCLSPDGSPWRNRQGLPVRLHHTGWQVRRWYAVPLLSGISSWDYSDWSRQWRIYCLFEIAFQLFFQFAATIVIHIESFIFLSHYNQLLLLYGKTRVDKQDCVFFLVTLAACKERGKSSLHGTCNGYASFRRYVYVDECLIKRDASSFNAGKPLISGYRLAIPFCSDSISAFTPTEEGGSPGTPISIFINSTPESASAFAAIAFTSRIVAFANQ